MKTIKEVLETLEEPYRSQSLENLDLEHHVNKSWERSEKLQSEAIVFAFDWCETKEGYEYWYLFQEELENKGL